MAAITKAITTLRDRIMGKEKAEHRQREIESLLDQLGIDSELGQMRGSRGGRSI